MVVLYITSVFNVTLIVAVQLAYTAEYTCFQNLTADRNHETGSRTKVMRWIPGTKCSSIKLSLNLAWSANTCAFLFDAGPISQPENRKEM